MADVFIMKLLCSLEIFFFFCLVQTDNVKLWKARIENQNHFAKPCQDLQVVIIPVTDIIIQQLTSQYAGELHNMIQQFTSQHV